MSGKKLVRKLLLKSIGVITALVLLILLFLYAIIRDYYYSSAKNYLDARVNYVSSLISDYALDKDQNYGAQVRNLIENFADKNKIEMMALSRSGTVLITSSGFEFSPQRVMEDFVLAEESDSGTGQYLGKGEFSSKIMATTLLSPNREDTFHAIRMVISLDLIDRQIVIAMLTISGVALFTILFIIIAIYLFVRPVSATLHETAAISGKIAKGNFEARLHIKSDDELGELGSAVNNMAKELQKSEKLKNDFMSSVSHELRTPLTAIKGWSETIANGPMDEEIIQKGMGVITQETERLSNMVEELLDFSRIQNGRFKLHLEKVDLVAELTEAYIMFMQRAQLQGVFMIYEEPEFLPVIQGDPDRLKQVFVNIIDNAIKYSSPADTIKIEANPMEDGVEIIVSDTGCGISKEDLPLVKNKFYKANQSVRGSGIGLAVANEIVELHGGKLIIESELGIGTMVRILLPAENKGLTD